MIFLLGFLRIAWPYLLGAAILGGGWLWMDNRCNSACQRVEKRLQTAEGKIKVAEQRATDIALLWSAQVTKTDEAVRAKEKENAEIFADLKAKAAAASRANPIRFSADSVVVFDRARDAATAGPAAVPDKAAPPAADSAEVYVVELYEWASVCRARVEAWQTFYKGLQDESR